MGSKNILIKGARIIDPSSPYHRSEQDVLIKDNTIYLNNAPLDADEIIEAAGLHLSKGWFDLRAYYGEPGFEYKETIETGAKASIAGGFTSVCLMPDTIPPTDHASQISYIFTTSAHLPIRLFPIGCITAAGKGKELAELFDMHKNGALAFSDGNKTINDCGLLIRALKYTSPWHIPLMLHANEDSISAGGMMHEGTVSVSLGLKGIPDIAEWIAVQTACELLRFAGGQIHFSHISTRGSVEIIRQAKSEGLSVTCDVSIHHLVLTDEALSSFDSNYKITPPLRNQKHVEALIEAVCDGTIDAIVSDHKPESFEQKVVEFSLARTGVIASQLVYPLFKTYLENLIPEDIFIQRLTDGPSSLLHLPQESIIDGSHSDLTLYNPSGDFILNQNTNLSKSSNSPFYNKPLKGKVIRTFFNH